MVFGAGTPPGDSSCFTLGFSRFWADTIHGRPRDTHDCDIGLSGNGSGTVGRAVPGRNLIRSGPPARYTHSKTCRPHFRLNPHSVTNNHSPNPTHRADSPGWTNPIGPTSPTVARGGAEPP